MPLDAATAPPALQYAEIVRRMEELLARPENWCQGETQRGTAMCMMAALYFLEPRPSQHLPIYNRLKIMMGGSFVDVWNDDPARTHADVLDLLARTRRYFEEAV